MRAGRLLGTPAFAVPTLEAIVRGRARSRGGVHPAGPAQGPRRSTGAVAGEGSRAAARPRRSTSRSACAGRKPSSDLRGASAPTRWWWSATGRSFRRRSSICRRSALSMCTPRCCRSTAARRRSSGRSRNGETRTGVTTMRIDAGLDTGDMLLKAETEIGPDENALSNWARGWRRWARICWWRRSTASQRARSCRRSRMTRRPPSADPEEGRRRIDWTRPGGRDIQSGARLSALAGRVHALSRAAVAHLEGKT